MVDYSSSEKCEEYEVLKEILDIYQWDGVQRNINLLNKMLKKNELIEYLNGLKFVLDKLSKSDNYLECAIELSHKFTENGPYYIDSGLTKVYALLFENFIIYDGRVGAALCYLVKNYVNNDPNSIGENLSFVWKGDSKRNPWPECTHKAIFRKFNKHMYG